MNDEKEKTPAKKGGFWRWMLKATIVAALLFVAFILSIPYLVTHVPIPELEFDLSPCLKGKLAEAIDRKSATVNLEVRRGKPEGYRVRATGQLLDWSYSATAHVRVGFVKAEGDLSLALNGTDWRLFADFAANGTRDWNFTANVKERTVTREDAVVAALLPRLAPNVASNLVFSGTFSLDAEGSCTPKRPVAAWTVRGSLKDVDATYSLAGGKQIDVDNLRVRFGADGIADHKDIAPLFPRADVISAAGFTLSNVFASVRATERSYLVTEAGAECCGGELKLYSLFLDPERLSAGATVFAEGVDAGEVLAHISAFNGTATGRLHGKLPFFLKDGRRLHLGDSYLFSTPGTTGTMRITNAQPILDNLAVAGVSEADRANLSKALANLDYKVLKVELVRGDDGEDSALALGIEGTSTYGKTTVPVKLDVTFHADLDLLVNTGMTISRRKQ